MPPDSSPGAKGALTLLYILVCLVFLVRLGIFLGVDYDMSRTRGGMFEEHYRAAQDYFDSAYSKAYPPLLYYLGKLVLFLLGDSPRNLLYLNIWLLGLCFGFFYLFAQKHRWLHIGLSAAILLTFFPAICEMSMTFSHELAIGAWLLLFLYFAVDDTKDGFKYIIRICLVFVIGMLIKYTLIFYCIPFLGLALVKVVRDPDIKPLRILKYLSPLLLLIPFYYLMLPDRVSTVALQPNNRIEPIEMLQDWRLLVDYFAFYAPNIPLNISFVITIIGSLALLAWLLKSFIFLWDSSKAARQKRTLLVVIGVNIPCVYLIFTLIPIKGNHYLQPLTPMIALFIAVVLHSIFRRRLVSWLINIALVSLLVFNLFNLDKQGVLFPKFPNEVNPVIEKMGLFSGVILNTNSSWRRSANAYLWDEFEGKGIEQIKDRYGEPDDSLQVQAARYGEPMNVLKLLRYMRPLRGDLVFGMLNDEVAFAVWHQRLYYYVSPGFFRLCRVPDEAFIFCFGEANYLDKQIGAEDQKVTASSFGGDIPRMIALKSKGVHFASIAYDGFNNDDMHDLLGIRDLEGLSISTEPSYNMTETEPAMQYITIRCHDDLYRFVITSEIIYFQPASLPISIL